MLFPALKSWRSGITFRLSAAFLVVGAFTAAANMIAERGATIVTTSWTRPVSGPAPNTSQVARRPASPALDPASIRASVPAPPPLPTPTALSTAREAYERAVITRMASNSQPLQTQLEQAAAAWHQQTERFLDAATGTASYAQRRQLIVASRDFEQRSVAELAATDERRSLLTQYGRHLDGLQTQIGQSLDKALKIFGRVIARQYLIEMRDELDEVRRQSVSLTTQGYGSEASSALDKAENAFAVTLERNRSRLTGPQGAQWLELVQSDLHQLGELRKLLQQLDSQHAALQLASSQAAARLETRVHDIATVRGQSGASTARIPSMAAAPPAPPAAGSPVVPTGAASPLDAAPAAAVVTTETRPASAPASRVLVAAISIVLLAVLLAICVGTVRSIVLPVARLMQATARLAAGAQAVQVPRGGLKELDSLAVAFNLMSQQLGAARATAQGYLQQLEQRVEERTRQLQHEAEHDPLTQLPNRRQLFANLNAALERCAREARPLGVFFLDLDNFKNINDGMGHAFGDRLLVAIANRLRETTAGWGFVARFGGDEFTVVHESARDTEQIRVAGQQLVSAFQQPLEVDESELLISVSVGASLYPEHHESADALLRAADAALFRAKSLGRSQLTLFTPELLEAATSRFAIEQGLRRAMERGEFELVYQPEISNVDFNATLVEALLRWRLPDGRHAAPGEFLAIAEESGLIMEISDWVLQQAIATAARWHAGAWPEVRVAINVSSRQLFDHRFVGRIMTLLQEYALPPRCIEIELTETVLQTGAATIEALQRLRDHGLGIALDDFGTGYSSIASLEQLPITRVKLDRSLIASIDTSHRSAAIARAIITLCHGLGLEITAEGIERSDQLLELLDPQPLYLQGYLVATPVSEGELMGLLAGIPTRMRSLLRTITDQPEFSDRLLGNG